MSPSSCVRCSRPLPTGSSSELCPVCLSDGDTSQGRDQTPLPDLPVEPETLTEQPPPPEQPAGSTVSDPSVPAADVENPITASEPPANLDGTNPSPPPGYDLLRRLGGGAMGDVFLAREQTTQRVMAIKFLRSPGSPTAVERFLAEVRALGRINHPHIIRVLATDFYRHQPFFTMDYASGGALSERVTARGPLEPEEAARLIATVARAMQSAHNDNIYHRDLKPSNILLAEDGTPRVSDFGLAKFTDLDDGITIGSGPLGTPSYMPPEQVSSRHGPIGPAADVYGLGATLYHLVTGRAPFNGETPAEVTGKVERDLPERPRALRPDLPVSLEAIIVKCLEKRSSDRYASPNEMAAELDKYLTGERPKARPLTKRRRLQRWVARRRAWVAGSAVVLLAVASAFIVGFFFPHLFGSDPLKQMQRDLAAGKPVTLIGETGLPKWHRWAYGPCELGLSTTGDGTCAFETSGPSFLELCPDPMVSKYLIKAQIRLARSKMPAPGTTSCGVYFGYGTSPGVDGAFAMELLYVAFDDTPIELPAKGKKLTFPEFHLRRFLLLLDPNGGKQFSEHPTIDHTPFLPATQVPGPWRPIEIEVSPEGVRCWWQEQDGTMMVFSDQPAAFLREQYSVMRGKIDQKAPNHGTALPDWSPRMSIGIWNNRGAVDIRSFSITPLR